MAKSKKLFQIHILKFKHYNPGKGKSYKKTMISNNFLTDGKISVLPMSARWMFLGLVLTCGDHASDTIELGESQLRAMLESSKSVSSVLDQLQSLELLTYSEISLIEVNRIEKKIREKKRIPETSEKSKDETPKIQNNPDLNRVAWISYRDAFVLRWKQEPIRDAKANSTISNIVKRIGSEAAEVLKFFVSHNDGFYIKSTHSLGLALRDIETLRTQYLNGKAITSTDVRKFEKQQSFQSTLDKLDRHEI